MITSPGTGDYPASYRHEPDLLHPSAICKHGDITLREAQNAVAWVVVTEWASVYSLLRGTLSNPAEGRATLTSATTAPRLGFRKVTQERPEFPEDGTAMLSAAGMGDGCGGRRLCGECLGFECADGCALVSWRPGVGAHRHPYGVVRRGG